MAFSEADEHNLTSLQDVRYLKPHVESVEQEELERRAWDNMVLSKK